jgi:hypothetical protein
MPPILVYIEKAADLLCGGREEPVLEDRRDDILSHRLVGGDGSIVVREHAISLKLQ